MWSFQQWGWVWPVPGSDLPGHPGPTSADGQWQMATVLVLNLALLCFPCWVAFSNQRLDKCSSPACECCDDIPITWQLSPLSLHSQHMNLIAFSQAVGSCEHHQFLSFVSYLTFTGVLMASASLEFHMALQVGGHEQWLPRPLQGQPWLL